MVRFSAGFDSVLAVSAYWKSGVERGADGWRMVREAVPEYGSESQGYADLPSPYTDADALDELAEEITTLAAHIHAATHRLLTLIAEYDRRRGWELGGHRSCAHWLHFRTGIDLGAAREKVRAARALEGLPETSASMARGELSFSKIRALTRVATPDTETDLLELARGCTTAQLERVIRAFRRGSQEDEAALEKERHQRRRLSIFPDDDGMYVIQGRVTAEAGALLMRAVEAAGDVLYREERGVDGSQIDSCRLPLPEEVSRTEAARRRADAVGLLAEWALAAGFENGPVSGSRASRYQVVLHLEPETLKTEDPVSRFKRELLAWDARLKKRNVSAETSGRPTSETSEGSTRETSSGSRSEMSPGPTWETSRSHLEDGTHVSAETSRRVSCDCGVVRVHHGEDGSILNVGRKTRSIPPALRRALEVRDQGCRFPGCGLRFTDAHHLKHWANGGETSLENTLLLCSYHHRLVHEGGWTVEWWGKGRPVFMNPLGHVHFEGGWEAPKELEGRTEGCGEGSMHQGEGHQGECCQRDDGQPEGSREEAFEGKIGEGNVGQEKIGQGKISQGNVGQGRPGSGRVEELLEENRRRGVDPGPHTASARWKREMDIPGEVLWPAEEALL